MKGVAVLSAAFALSMAQPQDANSQYIPQPGDTYLSCAIDGNCRQFGNTEATCNTTTGRCECSPPQGDGWDSTRFCGFQGSPTNEAFPTTVVFSFDYSCAITMANDDVPRNWTLVERLREGTRFGFERALVDVNVTFSCGRRSTHIIAWSPGMTEQQARNGAVLAVYEQNQRLRVERSVADSAVFTIASKRTNTTIQLGGTWCSGDEDVHASAILSEEAKCVPVTCNEGYRIEVLEENDYTSSCEKVYVDDDELGDGAVVGFVLGCILALVVLIALVLICTHKEPEPEIKDTEPVAE